MENPNVPNPDTDRSKEAIKPIDYRRPTTREPHFPLDAEKYERDGWIGLIVTLIVCTIAFVLWVIFHKSTDSF